MKYLKLIIALSNLAAFIALQKDNALLRRKLGELTDKYWEGNRQIALYSDEVNRLKAGKP